jgi:biopolymer transport protein TolR
MATASFRRHRKRKLKAEINVVPYIDVMLVLLIIFMVTAPLLNVGVDVNLPQADAKKIADSKKKPVVVQVARDGGLALAYEGVDRPREVTRQQLVAMVREFVSKDPNLAVYVAGDREVSYQAVYEILTLLQKDANVPRAGLMGEPAQAAAAPGK